MINYKGEEVGIIYGWYNTLTDMWYVGQTIHPEARFKSHIYFATRIKNSNHFYRAIRKYGLDNFVYCVLEENVLFENLNMREMDWIEYYDSFYNGYNLTLGGDGAKGVILSKEARRKISESHKGKPAWNSGKHGIYSEETLRKISQSNTNPSKETRRKMSEARKRKPGLKGPKNHNYGKPANNRRKVSKYDLNGNYIQTYTSIAEAKSQNPKAKHLNDVCRGERKQAGGFIWKYA